jgi:hypothetical protein
MWSDSGLEDVGAFVGWRTVDVDEEIDLAVVD